MISSKGDDTKGNQLSATGGDDSSSSPDRDHLAQAAKDNYSYEINDLRGQLEKQTIEIKRKDKENSNLLKQIALLQKDSQESLKEIRTIKSRNDYLQKALIETKLDFEKYEEEDNISKMKTEVKELTATVATWAAKYEAAKADYDKSMKHISLLKQEQTTKDLLVQEYRDKDNAFKKDIEELSSSNLVLNKLVEELRKDIKDSRSDFNKSEFACMSIKEENIKNCKMISDLEASLRGAQEEVKKLQGVIAIRNETNAMLRDQVDDVHQSLHSLTIDEWNAVKKIEQDNVSLSSRCKDLVKSVDLHIQLQKRAEEESNRTKDLYVDLNAQFQYLQKEMDAFRSSNGADNTALKQAQKELKHLRKEKKELLAKLGDVNIGSGNTNTATALAPPVAAPPSAIAAFDDEARNNERKKRELAENSVQELRSRIFILLEQIDSFFQLSLTWEEQKLVMQAEIAALHDTNRSLRKKIQGEIDSSSSSSNLNFRHNKQQNSELPLMPASIEATIERYLFDITCAFSSGKRTPISTKNSSSGNANFKSIDGSFKMKSGQDGFLHIEFVKDSGLSSDDIEDNNDGYSQTFAEDILNNLQISNFIRLVQEKREVKVLELFTDKLVSILNFHMNMSQELFNQIGESRMNAAKTVAQTSFAREHIHKANLFATKEKTAKQKAVIKFVREQMRISDISTIVRDLEENSKSQVRKAESESDAFRDAAGSNDIAMVKGITSQLQTLSEDIKLVNVPSGVALVPRGALELRLQDCQICDDTIHGIVSLLDGKLKEAPDDSSSAMMMMDNVSNALQLETISGGSKGSINTLELDLEVQQQQRVSILRGVIGGDSYFKKVILLNLRSNQLTDVACKMLTALVEQSPEIRMLDLRDNFISITGKGILFESVRKNKTVLYVSQKQNGDMIEGHREIVGSRSNNNDTSNANTNKAGATKGGVKSAASEETVGGSKYDFERLVGNAKFPLRIDMRGNESESHIIEDKLKTVFFGSKQSQNNGAPFATQGSSSAAISDGANVATYNRNKSANTVVTDSFRGNSVALGYSIGSSAKTAKRDVDSDNSDDDSSAGGGGGGGDKGTSTLKKGIPSILDIIKSNANNGNHDSAQANDVGKMLDDKIRHIEESAAFSSSTSAPPTSLLSAGHKPVAYSGITPKKPPSSPQKMSTNGVSSKLGPASNTMNASNFNNYVINSSNNNSFVDQNVINMDQSMTINADFDLTYPPPMPHSSNNNSSYKSLQHSSSSSSIVRDKLVRAKLRDKGSTPLMSSTTGALGLLKSSISLLAPTNGSSNGTTTGRGGGVGRSSMSSSSTSDHPLASSKSSAALLEGLNKLNPSMLF